MKRLLLMITFFTRIPVKYPYEYKEDDLIKGIYYFPVIGLIIGLFLYLISMFSKYLDRPIVSVFIWVGYLWITGGLHIDGLSDTVDGIFSNRDRQKTLEIMKDSRIGTFGVLAIIIIIMLNVILVNYIDFNILILVPIAGRCCAIISCSMSEYARKGMGMGKAFVENSDRKKRIVAIIFMILSAIIIHVQWVFSMVLCIVFTIYITNYIRKRIGGMTGDTIGFVIEVTQTFFILSSYILQEIIV